MIIQLIEYADSINIELDSNMVNEIKRASNRWRKKLKLKYEPIEIKKDNLGKFTIRAKGIAGFIRVGNITIEIAPKILNEKVIGSNWQTTMWRYLMYGYGLEVIGETSGKEHLGDGIADVLATMYLLSLKGANAKGYPLGYNEKRFQSTFVKGRLDPQKYATLLPFTGKVGVITSELTQDTPINRLLKWAGIELARTVQSSSLRKNLKSWASDLSNVSQIPPKINQVGLLKHQYSHLNHAIEIATILLEDRKVGFENGKYTLPGFLWDSDNLFERVSLRLFSEASRKLGLNASKRTHKLAHKMVSQTDYDKGKQPFTDPDIDIWNEKGSALVVDAKYKPKTKHPAAKDFYQIMAAGRVAKVKTVALLYPTEGCGLSEKTYKPQGEGLPENIIILNIGLQSFSSKDGIYILVEDIKKWVEVNSWT